LVSVAGIQCVSLLKDANISNHYSVISEERNGVCNTMWGYNGAPSAMTLTGQTLFINSIYSLSCYKNRFAYIYADDVVLRDAFESLLNYHGIVMDRITVAQAETFDFSKDRGILIGTDSGSSATWGNPATVDHVNAADLPIIGLGEGGYAFMGKLGLAIGYPNGSHDSAASITVVNPADSIYFYPHVVDTSSGNLALYDSKVPEVDIFYNTAVIGVIPYGQYVSAPNFYHLIAQMYGAKRYYALWGFTGGPSAMMSVGQDLFINYILAGQNWYRRYLPLVLVN
jgi:hypothetical protein